MTVADSGNDGASARIVDAVPLVVSTSTRSPRSGTWSLNYWTWIPAAGDDIAGTEAFVSALTPAILRIGGYNNDANAPDAFDSAQLDKAVAYARSIGAEPLIQVPVLKGPDGQPPTPASAAAMVTYSNITRGYGIKYFSVGNEPDLYPIQGLPSDPTRPARPGYTPSDYCATTRAFVGAMKEVDPSIQIVGPDLSFQYQRYDDWLTPILQQCGDLLDIVSVHRYPFDAANATIENAAGDIPTFRQVMTSIRSLMQAAGYGLKPLALTETNVAFDATPAGSAPPAAPGTVPSALWLADILGSSFQLNLWTSTVWDISDTDDYSLGLLGLPPAHTPRPQYYAMKLYADHFGSTLVDVTAAPFGVDAYASRNRAEDATALIVVNWNLSSVGVAVEVTGLSSMLAIPIFVLPPVSISAIEVPDRGQAAAWTYGDKQHFAASGPEPLAPGAGVVIDGGEQTSPAGESGQDGALACPGVVPPNGGITTLGQVNATMLTYGPPSDSWGSFTYAGTGQSLPVATVTPDGNGLHISAQLVASGPSANYAGVGLYYANSKCLDASTYTGLAFELSGDLGGCSLSFESEDSGHVSPTYDPMRGSCSLAPTNCYGPSAQVLQGMSTVRLPFTALTGGMPMAPLDARAIINVIWQLIAPSGGTDGGGCSADFTVHDVAFY